MMKDLLKPDGVIVVSSMKRDADISKIYVDSIAELPPDRQKAHFGLSQQQFEAMQQDFLNDAAPASSSRRIRSFQLLGRNGARGPGRRRRTPSNSHWASLWLAPTSGRGHGVAGLAVAVFRRPNLDALARLTRGLTRASIQRPRVTIWMWLAFLTMFAGGARFLEIESSISSLLVTSGPSWDTYQRSLDQHGSDEFVTIAVSSENSLDEAALQRVVDFTHDLSKIPGVERVDGLASIALIRDNGVGDLALDAALAGGIPKSKERKETAF